MKCDAKIRPFNGAATMPETELTCSIEHGGVAGNTMHLAVLTDYAYPGSRTEMHWMEADRRTFRGEWQPCDSEGCILPLSHGGLCAR